MKKRLVALDGLRGMAIIAIAFFWHFQHFSKNTSQYPFYVYLRWFYESGWNFVDLLFVISGFVAIYTYAQDIFDKKIGAKDFVLRRFIRLYPLHILTLLFVTFLLFYRGVLGFAPFVFQVNNVYHFVLNVLLLHGGVVTSDLSFNAPSWVVATEFWISIIFFVIVSKTTFRYGFFLCMVFFGLLIIKNNSELPILNGHMARGLVGFFLGCITYKINQQKGRVLVFCIIALVCGIIFDVLFHDRFFPPEGINSLPMLIYSLLIIFALRFRVLAHLLSLQPLLFIGNLSYVIFLIHFPIQILIDTAMKYWQLAIPLHIIFNIYVFSTIGIAWRISRYTR